MNKTEINDFEINDFDLLGEFDDDFNDENDLFVESVYIKPAKQKIINSKNIKFVNAQDLVKKIDLKNNQSIFAIVDGSFVFGDFILAFLHYHNIKAERIDISTLSASMHNIVGIEHFIKNGYIKNINFLIGYYFYAHERNKLVREIYNRLNINDCLQLAVCRNHMKCVTILSDRGNKIVIHGSANLRSSDNLEQFSLNFDSDMYDFITSFNDKILNEFKTIKKPITNKNLIKL